MSQQELATKTKALSLFSGFNAIETAALLSLVDVVSFETGAPIVRQDEEGDGMYVLLDGEATVIHHSGGRNFTLASLGPGDFFGELALVDHGPRSADVVAASPCRLLKLTEAAIRALAGTHPSAAFKLLFSVGKILVARLRYGNQKYIDSMLSFPGKA